jgi:hypothetical protein
VNVDLRQNVLSAVGIVCGVAGLAVQVLAIAAIVLGIVAKKRTEKLWWWAVVAGAIGFFGSPLLHQLLLND